MPIINLLKVELNIYFVVRSSSKVSSVIYLFACFDAQNILIEVFSKYELRVIDIKKENRTFVINMKIELVIIINTIILYTKI